MKVSDLITALSCFDPEAKVAVHCNEDQNFAKAVFDQNHDLYCKGSSLKEIYGDAFNYVVISDSKG